MHMSIHKGINTTTLHYSDIDNVNVVLLELNYTHSLCF